METAGGKELRTVRSPYDDGEELVAMPALHLDAALVHLNRADARGNAQYLGPDPYFDDLFVARHSRPRGFGQQFTWKSCRSFTARRFWPGPVLRRPRETSGRRTR